MSIESSAPEPRLAVDAASSWPGGPEGPEGSFPTELKKRIWFTLGALVIYRLGTYVPIPGIHPELLEQLFYERGAVLGIMDMYVGGSLNRMTIFALGILPYISALIIMQLLIAVSPRLAALRKAGEAGRKKINQYTRYGTLILCVFQAYSLAVGLEGEIYRPVIDPGLLFRFTTVVTLTCGTIFLMWLGEQITQRGVGNGISLIIFAGIVANLPSAIAGTLELGRTGALSAGMIPILMVVSVTVVAFILFMERAQRRIIVQYPKREVGNKMFGGEASHLPLKLNSSGIVPPIFAISLLLMPLTLASGPEWLTWIPVSMDRYQPFYLDRYQLFCLSMSIYIGLIAFFAFFYTAIVFNPADTADNLKKHGGFIPGIRPGKNTATYLSHVQTRLTVIGAGYLALVCLLPELLIFQFAVPFYLGGTSLLIVVLVTMDTLGQVHSRLLAQGHSGLFRRNKPEDWDE